MGNIDQTPILFVMDDNRTYERLVLVVTRGQWGLEKRQCTVQLTIFVDGSVLPIPSLLIFCGKGLQINPAKKKQWHRQSKVIFKPEAWCDEAIMKKLVGEDWNSIFQNQTAESSGKIFYVDVHRAQQTTDVKLCKMQNNPD